MESKPEDSDSPMEPILPEYTLEELLAGEIDPVPEVDWGKPMGKEVW